MIDMHSQFSRVRMFYGCVYASCVGHIYVLLWSYRMRVHIILYTCLSENATIGRADTSRKQQNQTHRNIPNVFPNQILMYITEKKVDTFIVIKTSEAQCQRQHRPLPR